MVKKAKAIIGWMLSHPLGWVLLGFAATFAVYVRTLLPGAVGGDAGELQYAGPLLALVHPTGQPLYVTLGYLWSHMVRVGGMAYRMNLLAAFSGAVACVILVWALYRLYGVPWIALTSGLTLGFGAAFWGQAVIADKYAFSALFASLVTGLALNWDKARGQPSGGKWLYALAAAYGVSLLHHRSMFMFAPGLALMVLLRERSALWVRRRRTLICLALALLPMLVVYPLYLPWVQARHLSPILWQPDSALGWLDWWLERHVISGEVLVFDSLDAFAKHLGIYWRTLVSDYTLVVLLVAVVGFWGLARRAPASLAFLLLTYVLVGMLAANYRGNERQFTYYLPSFVLLLYAYGAGLAALWEMAHARLGERRRWVMALGVVGVVLILIVPAAQFRRVYPLQRREAVYGAPLDIWRQTLKSGNQGERLAAGMANLPPNAVLLADWEQLTILWYYQKVEGCRPDLTLIYPLDRLADYSASQREICLARHLPVGAEWHPTNIGALVHLQRQPSMTVPQGITPLETVLLTVEGQPRLELVGYRGGGDAIKAGQHVPLLLTWRALVDAPEDYSISLRIMEGSRQVWARDIGAPVLGMYPTSRWVRGEVVQDYHELSIPREMSPGQYAWVVVVYRRLVDGSFVQLRDGSGKSEVLGGRFVVEPR